MALAKFLKKPFSGKETPTDLYKEIQTRLLELEAHIAKTGSKSYTPGTIADGAQVTTTVTVAGAALGNFTQAAFSLSLQGAAINAMVTGANTVTVIIRNNTGASITISAGTLSARVS